jgi:hypothetical protein
LAFCRHPLDLPFCVPELGGITLGFVE